ncbi:lipopolysaccharide assembly outer membrane protein LptD (OstA) [Catalinimonas alkaloidigena]|uniref:putative LPS assembly protein LptD n=1 Tax=Catalinimonas alkaloidigena TaxID=1075417 RepID=UPI002406760A|nr:putative LPS assembly protein LptD [Catalinimonas alkaloidigena]MDF9801020.1 lipopolysaccharide assembly outer membrane protein LptD (OstA) [Catalinimonas alkaloidigena]
MTYLKYVCSLSILFFLFPDLSAQEGERPFQSDTTGILSPSVLDTIPPDTIPNDNLPVNDTTTTVAIDSSQAQGDIETTVNYNAEDSIFFDVVNRKIYLYGNAEIDYGEIKLAADYVELDWVNNMLTAKGMPDSTGKVVGQPIFTDGPEEYQTETIRYNFKTRKAYISGVLTRPQEAEGYVYGEKVKKNENDEVFISKGWYTPCDCEPGETPDLYIRSRKLKVVPGELVVAGPFNLVITDIPTPLGLPFGIFPMPRRQNSGIIIPTYGEERRRGFFLKNGGYYFDINDYVNLTLLGDIYSKGSYGFSIISDYRKRYAYNGGLNFQYNRQLIDPDGASPEEANDFRLNFRHTPQSRGNSRFSASVNIATSSYIQNNPTTNVEANLRTTLSSTVTYSTAFRNTPFNLAMSFRHNQNLVTEVVNVILPEISLNMNRIYPFKNVVTSRSSWLSKVNVGYRMSGRNQFTNEAVRAPSGIPSDIIANRDPLADSVLAINGDNLSAILDRTQTGFEHSIPISTSFNVFNYFTVSPSFNYEELWYLKEYDYDDETIPGRVIINEVPGFSRASSWNASTSVNTRFYGLFNFRGEKLQAIRHTVIPSVSVSYRPDFSEERYGYYQEVRLDDDPLYDPNTGYDRNLKLVSIYDGFIYGAPSPGKSGSVGFSLNNNLEMKVRNDKDTTEEASATRKIPIFESLSLSTSYNLIADSFKLAPLNVSGRTRLFDNKVSINASMSMDPYSYIPDTFEPIDSVGSGSNLKIYRNFTRTDIYAWQSLSERMAGDTYAEYEEAGLLGDIRRGIGTITRASLALSTNFQPKQKEKDKQKEEEEADVTADELDYINRNRSDYVDFDIPWSIRLRYNLSYTNDPRRMLIEGEDDKIRQSVMFSGDVSIAPKWKVQFNSGFDFVNQEITQTSIDVFRDLGCFDFQFNWVPFGRFTSYHVQINVKSAMLSDLKLQRRRAWQDF